MIPVLWEIPGLGWSLPGYGVALMIGFLVSIWWGAKRALRSGANPDVVLNCGFLALFGGVVGSRVMYVWHYWDQFARRDDLLWALLDVRKGGLEVYGGVLLVVVSVLIYLRLWKHSIRWYLDIIAPSAALGMGIGRIGCFLNGCCWGGMCELPWSVQFPYGSNAARQHWIERRPGADLPKELVFVSPQALLPDGSAAQPISRELLNWDVSDADIARAVEREQALAAEIAGLRQQEAQAATAEEKNQLRARAQALQRKQVSLPYYDIRVQMKRYGVTSAELRAMAVEYRSLSVHPVQLYSTVTLLVLAAFLNALYWQRRFDGQVICVFLLVEPLTRWALEVLRADNPVDTLGMFTISQGIGVGMSAMGLLGLVYLRTRSPRSHRAVKWEPPEEEGAPAKA